MVATYSGGNLDEPGSQVRLKLGGETPRGHRRGADGAHRLPGGRHRGRAGPARGVSRRSGRVESGTTWTASRADRGAGHYIPRDTKTRRGNRLRRELLPVPRRALPHRQRDPVRGVPGGDSSGVVAATSVSTCVACAEDTSADGRRRVRLVRFRQMSNHGNTVRSSSMLISIVTVLVAMFVGTAALAQATFKFGNSKVSRLMELAIGGGKTEAEEDAADEDAAIKSMNAILMESRVTSSASGAVESAAKSAVAAASALTGLNREALALAVAPVVARRRRSVEAAINATVEAGSAGGADIVAEEADAIATATKEPSRRCARGPCRVRREGGVKRRRRG